MPTHGQHKQQQPRRILEKSRTVRRRYQRSNKRFEFTASQIEQIEREEEREKKAKQLREREKRKLANKKKRAEKEAKQREERRRLGIPDPNTVKIPASQPLLVNFLGARRNSKLDEVKGQIQEEAEDFGTNLEPENSEGEELDESGDDGHGDHHISPVQEEADVLQQQQQPSKTEEAVNCVSEDFSDLETELGDDLLDDIDLEKHIASIENSQKSLNSSATTHNAIQTQVPAQSMLEAPPAVNSLSESFEDDTSLLLQTLDPTILENFENPKPTAVSHDLNKTKGLDAEPVTHPVVQSSSAPIHALPNVKTVNTQYVSHIANNLTPTKFSHASRNTTLGTSAHQPSPKVWAPNQQPVQKQQLECPNINKNVNSASIYSAPSVDAFKKSVAVASSSLQQRGHLHSLPEKCVNQDTKTLLAEKSYPQSYVDVEDEFGDLPLSTQDVRDLDMNRTIVGDIAQNGRPFPTYSDVLLEELGQ
ncbi:conserved hypothetical protein [Talaromyces stipitatus ATCC 10500]|uniref:Uncharacterized protein n=1 Tax=Talaromyces stipitatus (strain ATCC 10500 / CBS 375.48 / QM 6759 / NRRL 1006) TaxID=441959 RepID=B8MEI7_TALSN|nr:uncharacterized protein TSTA_016890 [Talaromyces stipitatus ATCC 10500]EED16614.1 conserved hypothetical protein [Talaromyces stipitatus ATCC 10500]